jgi:hypothetical protein
MHQEMKCVCKRCKSRTRIMCLQGKSTPLARFPGAMRPSIPEIVACMHQIKVLRFRHVLRLSTPNKGFSRGGEQSRKKAKDEKSTPSARFPADSTAAAHGKCGFTAYEEDTVTEVHGVLGILRYGTVKMRSSDSREFGCKMRHQDTLTRIIQSSRRRQRQTAAD